MTTTAIIGFDSPLGQSWSGKRYFDCLVNEQNDSLLRGRSFGHVAIICPSLWDKPADARETSALAARIRRLMEVLGEAKIERLTYVTSLELIEDSGNENNRIVPEDESCRQGLLAGFEDFLNLLFGRVVTLRVGDLVGMQENPAGWSVLDELTAARKAKRKIKAGLLVKHQLYPVNRIVADSETAWECGLSEANLTVEPLTTFELVERLMPEMTDSLPIAKESDPVGSARTSLYAIHWNDLNRDFILGKEDMLAVLEELITQK